MLFYKRLRALRQEQGLSQQGLADALGISKSSINMYERGEREPNFTLIAAMADHFGVDTDYLLGRSAHKNKEDPAHRIPLLGEIACGKPIFAHEEKDQFAEPAGIRADFCLRAKGDSMIGARIMDGDLVFIRRQPMVENGEIAAVVIDDSATLKRVHFHPEEGVLTLMAENPRYAPLIYAGEELSRIRILGKAVAFQSKLGD
ncbi:MAG: helix-turn-helix domain-containing protein [Clostridia bacterium]|nr:helix-turn-helix domain-containing protein [Clostridia bacterium]